MIDVLLEGVSAQPGEPQPCGQPLTVAFRRLAFDQHGQVVIEAVIGGRSTSSAVGCRSRWSMTGSGPLFLRLWEINVHRCNRPSGTGKAKAGGDSIT